MIRTVRATEMTRDGFTNSPHKDVFCMHYIMRATAIKDEIAESLRRVPLIPITGPDRRYR